MTYDPMSKPLPLLTTSFEEPVKALLRTPPPHGTEPQGKTRLRETLSRKASESKGTVIRLVGLVAAVVFVVYAASTSASIGVDGPNGFRVNMNATFEPGGHQAQSGVMAGPEGRLHRIVFDGGQRYFAYYLVMVASGSDGLRVAVEPLSLSEAELAKTSIVDRSWTAVPLLNLNLREGSKPGTS